MIRDVVYIALFAAIMAALGLIPKIDMAVGVPITAQSMGVMLAGAILGPRRGALAMGLFLGLVAAGLPLLAGGRGGMGVFFGPSAGFLLAYPIAAFAIGWMTERLWPRLDFLSFFVVNLAGGIGVLYAFGVPGVALVTGTPLLTALIGSLVFLPGDIVKAAIAAAAANFVRRGYPLIGPRRSAP